MVKDFEWDYKAAGELLLKSEEIAEFCQKQAQRLSRETGMEYRAGMTSQRVVIEPEDKE